MKVLITGAAGKVGTAVRGELSGRHSLRLYDIVPIPNAEGEMVIGSVVDFKAVRAAMEGIEGVIHLSYGRAQEAPATPDEWSFDVNVKGTYNVLKAAWEVKARRAVYATTLSVFDGFHRRRESPKVSEETPPFPGSEYGLTKYLGEEVCRYFAKAHGLSVVCLRLSGVTTPEEWAQVRDQTALWNGWRTSTGDVARAFRMALEADGIGYELIHICGDNTGRPTEIERARQVLGFVPQDRFV